MVVKELVLLPVILSLLLGLGLQLADIADHMHKKTLAFATDADAAVDCAFRGIDIKYCAPNITRSSDFSHEAVRLNSISRSIQTNLTDAFLLVYDNNKTIAFRVKSVDGQMMLIESNATLLSSSPTGLSGHFFANLDKYLVLSKRDPTYVDLDKDGLYDLQLAYDNSNYFLKLVNRPSLGYFFNSWLIVLGLIGLVGVVVYGLFINLKR